MASGTGAAVSKGPEITIDDMNVAFGAVTVLNRISISLPAGSSTVIIGPSGAGKTVFLKTLAGLYEPGAGRIAFERSPLIGMLFQRSGLFDSLPVWENIAFRLLQDSSLTRSAARDIAIDKLIAVGLTADDADLFPVELSGGMQKRVGIARAIAHGPDVLLLDEPTAGLDPIMSNTINDLILTIAEQLGVTIVSVNSDMKGAQRTAETLIMLHNGDVKWTGPTSAMYESGNDFVDQFVNSRTDGPIPTITAPDNAAT